MRTCAKCGQLIVGLMCLNPKCGMLQPKIGAKTFDEYRVRVDQELDKLTGQTLDDLDDFDLRKAWDGNKSPIQAARAALRAAGF